MTIDCLNMKQSWMSWRFGNFTSAEVKVGGRMPSSLIVWGINNCLWVQNFQNRNLLFVWIYIYIKTVSRLYAAIADKSLHTPLGGPHLPGGDTMDLFETFRFGLRAPLSHTCIQKHVIQPHRAIISRFSITSSFVTNIYAHTADLRVLLSSDMLRWS